MSFVKDIFEKTIFIKSMLWQSTPGKILFPGFPNYFSTAKKGSFKGKIVYSTTFRGFKRNPPKTIEPKIDPIFSSQYVLEDKKSSIIEVPNGRVLSEYALIIDANNTIVYNDLDFFDLSKQHPVFRRAVLPPLQKLDATAAVFLPVNNYFHWLFEVVPRIGMLKDAGLNPEYVMTSVGNKFQDETLAQFGMQAKIIPVTKDTNMQVTELFVPSMPIFSGNPGKETASLIRSLFLKKAFKKEKKYSRIYVKRGNINRRVVVNEDEILAHLEKQGFVSVVLDGLSIAEQARIFSSAEVVIAPHGAALSNLVFCNTKTKVIEFFHPSYINPCYWAVSNCVNLDYTYFLAETADGFVKKHNVHVPLEKLKKALLLAKVN